MLHPGPLPPAPSGLAQDPGGEGHVRHSAWLWILNYPFPLGLTFLSVWFPSQKEKPAGGKTMKYNSGAHAKPKS